MTTPAIRALQQTFTDTDITLLCSSTGQQVVTFVPEISTSMVFNAPWVQTYGAEVSATKTAEIIETIRKQAFDAAIIFCVYTQNPLPAALLAYLSGIPLRLGYSHHNPYQLLTHWIPDPEPGQIVRHEVERQLTLVSAIGASTSDTRLSFQVPKESQGLIHHLLQQNNIKTNSWFVIHPGAREARRRYPITDYIHALAHLLSHWHGKIVITGTLDEMELSNQLVAALGNRVISLVGQLSLGDFAALLEAAPLVVTNNTGTAHIAAAVGTPVVDVYARTNTQHTPWQVEHQVLFFDVPCRDCERGICGRRRHPKPMQITPKQLSQAITKFLPRSRYASFLHH